jgi:PAS domain-containing protein
MKDAVIALQTSKRRSVGEEYDDAALFRLAVEASPDIIYVYDRLARRYLFVSSRCNDVLGYTPRQIEGLSIGMLNGSSIRRPPARADALRTARVFA